MSLSVHPSSRVDTMSALVQPRTASRSSITTSATTAASTLTSRTSHTSHTSIFTVTAPSSKESRRASLSLIESSRVRFLNDFRASVHTSSSRRNSTSSTSSRPSTKRESQRRPPSRFAQVRSSSISLPPLPELAVAPHQPREGGARARIVAFSAYAPIGSTVPTDDHSMPREESSRSGRGFGAKLVGFLSRSRSRSRSKKRRSQSVEPNHGPVGEVPVSLPGGSLGRCNAYVDLVPGPNASSSSSSASGARPITRAPSRPLSNATTITDTTARALHHHRRSPQNPAPPPKPNVIAAEHRVHLHTEVLAADPSSSTQKTKKANIFSVAISHPRKQASGDSGKAHTPNRAGSATPPASTERPYRGLWSGFRNVSRSGSQSSVGGQSTRSNVAENGSSTPSPLPPLPKPKQEKEKGRKLARLSLPPPEKQPVILNSPPPPYRFDEYAEEDVEPEDLDLGGRCSPLCGLPSPKLTGPTSPSVKGKEKERARGSRDRVVDAVEGRETRLPVEGILQTRRVTSPAARPGERDRRTAFTQPVERVGSNTGLGRQNSTKGSVTTAIKAKRIKHGSFDFERPVSTNTGGAPNMRTALNEMGVRLDAVAGPSTTYGLQRTKSAQSPPRAEQLSRKQSHKQSSSLPTAVGRPSRRPILDTHPLPIARKQTDSSRETISTQPPTDPNTPNSSQSGHSSSLGRSAGGRVLRNMHGPFRFEPAVPPIPGSPADEKRAMLAGRGPGNTSTSAHSGAASGMGAAVQSPSKLRQERATTKGRSLDLGLSLSWAPKRVSEEAVLAYARPSSRAAGTAPRPVPRWHSEGVDEEGRLEKSVSRAASDVARDFREALGDAAFATFKTYVHRFDAQAIPLDGQYGLISHATRLLDNASTLDERAKKELLVRFTRFVRENQ